MIASEESKRGQTPLRDPPLALPSAGLFLPLKESAKKPAPPRWNRLFEAAVSGTWGHGIQEWGSLLRGHLRAVQWSADWLDAPFECDFRFGVTSDSMSRQTASPRFGGDFWSRNRSSARYWVCSGGVSSMEAPPG